MADGGLKELKGLFKDISGIAPEVVSALNNVNDAVLKNGKSSEVAIKSIGNLAEKLGSVAGSSSDLLGSLTGLTSGFGFLSDAFNAIGGSIKMFSDGALELIRVTDSLSATNRQLIDSNFKLSVQFGGTLEAAEEYSEFMKQSSKELATADFGYQNFSEESLKMVEAFSNARLSSATLREEVTDGARSWNLYQMAVLQAEAAGMSMSEYANIMSDNILKQGMSVQESVDIISEYSAIAKETGLSTSIVSKTLSGLGDSFRKMGMDSNFGKNIMTAFAKSLSDVGLGIENAADLTQTFGSAMGNLSTNYSMSYLTAMRGGLNMGSGGALGAGIQMQAKLLDKNADQGQVGLELAQAISSTIKGLTGGNLVTLQEAAASGDARKEADYYTQTSMLGSLYGISDPADQARLIEVLKQLETGQGSSDSNELGKQLTEILDVRSRTKSEEDKMNAEMTATFTSIANSTEILSDILKKLTGKLSDDILSKAESGAEAFNDYVAENKDAGDDAFGRLGDKYETTDLSDVLTNLIGKVSGIGESSKDEVVKAVNRLTNIMVQFATKMNIDVSSEDNSGSESLAGSHSSTELP